MFCKCPYTERIGLLPIRCLVHIYPTPFLAIPAVGRCRLVTPHFKTIFLQPEGCTKASSVDYDSGLPLAWLCCNQVWSQLLERCSVLKFHHPNPFLTFQSDHYLLTVWNTADYCYEAAGFYLQASEELVLALLYKGVPLYGCIICPAAIRK